MFTVFLTTLGEMTRILMFMVLGFGLNRLHILPKGSGAGISRLITMVLIPALLIYNNMTEFQLANVGQYSQLVLMGVFLWTVMMLISQPIAKKLAAGNALDRGVYLYGLSFPNTGAVGMPLSLALLGTAGLFQFNLFLVMFSIMTYAWGVGLFLDTERKNPIKRFFVHLLNPVFVSMCIGMSLGAVGAKNWMPPLVMEFVGDLGGMFAPLSLLLTGYTIADYPLKEMFHLPKTYLFTSLRLLLFPLVAVLLVKLVGGDLLMATMAVIAFSGPSGMNVVVFPASYGQNCETGASIVMISSLGSILTVPLMYALVQTFF
jgi:predicted permease